MRPLWTVGAMTLALSLAMAAWGDELDKEKAKLQGTWVAVRAEHYGSPLHVKDLKVVVSGDKMTLQWPNKDIPKSFVLGSTDEHKTIDMTNLDGQLKGFVTLGIYSCEDDSLALCVCTNRKQVRPKAFATAPDSTDGRSLYIFRRAQP